MTPQEFLRSRPEKVAMIGLGPSANAFWLEASSFGDVPPWEQVWAVNKAAQAFHHDVCFHMHDLRVLCARHPHEKVRLLEARTPLVTVAAYPEFPAAVAYPIAEVLEHVQHDLLNSTPAYMVAYAMLIGCKEIWLYGMDFHYQNLERAEAGGQGMAYLLGMCQVLGITFRIPHTSSLLDAYRVQLLQTADGKQTPLRPLYGYAESRQQLDPRVPEGGKIVPLRTEGQMAADRTPRYGLGEAEAGDRADGQPAREPAPAAAGRA